MTILHLPKDVKSMNFFTENMLFPIVVYATSEQEEQYLEYLKSVNHSSESLCKWCISHEMSYQIMYPLSKMEIIKHPLKYFLLLKIKKKLKRPNQQT